MTAKKDVLEKLNGKTSALRRDYRKGLLTSHEHDNLWRAIWDEIEDISGNFSNRINGTRSVKKSIENTVKRRVRNQQKRMLENEEFESPMPKEECALWYYS